MEQQTHKNISLHLKEKAVTKMKFKQKQEEISCLEDHIWELHKAIKYADEGVAASEGIGILPHISSVKKSEEYKTLSKILNPGDRDDLK